MIVAASYVVGFLTAYLFLGKPFPKNHPDSEVRIFGSVLWPLTIAISIICGILYVASILLAIYKGYVHIEGGENGDFRE